MKFLLPLLLCVSLVACSTSSNTPIYQDTYATERVTLIYGSQSIKNWIKMGDIRIGMAGELPKFTVTLENKSQDARHIEYQIEWLDRDGFPLPVARQAWIRLSLPGHAQKHIMDVAKMPNAYSAQILIRDPKKIKIDSK